MNDRQFDICKQAAMQKYAELGVPQDIAERMFNEQLSKLAQSSKLNNDFVSRFNRITSNAKNQISNTANKQVPTSLASMLPSKVRSQLAHNMLINNSSPGLEDRRRAAGDHYKLTGYNPLLSKPIMDKYNIEPRG
jgi:dipeptidase